MGENNRINQGQSQELEHLELDSAKGTHSPAPNETASKSGAEDSEAVDVETPLALPAEWSWTRLEYLTRSSKRIRVLQYLQEQSGEKSELAEQLDIPRSTLLRTLKEMSEYGWTVETKNGVYDITPIGSIVIDLFEKFYRKFKPIAGLAQLYHILPAELTDECSVEFEKLNAIDPSEITVYLATSVSPYVPMRRFAERIQTRDISCVFLGTSNPFYNVPVRQLLKEGSIDKLIIPRANVEPILQYENCESRPIDQSVSVSITENNFRYGGFTTNDSLLIEGLDGNMKSQIVVELPFTSSTVSDLASQVIGQLEENATSWSE